MKKIIITLSLLTALSLPTYADEEGKERPLRPERPDPAEVAKEWIGNFDSNANGALEEAELTAAFTAARENRPERTPRPQMGNRGTQGPRGQQGVERPVRGERDPSQMIGRMIENFDTDGDKALNDAELKEALTVMNKQRRGGQNAPRGRKGPRQADVPAAG